MEIQENDIGLVSFDEFNEHQTNADDNILHVTKAEKDAWNGKLSGAELSTHRTSQELDHPDGSVTTDKIANDAVTSDKLSSELQNKITASDTHKDDSNNPHRTSKAQVGLGNVDNVQQAAKADFDAHKDNPVLAHPDGSVTREKIADESISFPKLGDDVKSEIEKKLNNTEVPDTVSVDGIMLMPVTFVDVDEEGNTIIRENGGGDYLLAIGANGKPYLYDNRNTQVRMKDQTTGDTYILYVNNGELRIKQSEV